MLPKPSWSTMLLSSLPLLLFLLFDTFSIRLLFRYLFDNPLFMYLCDPYSCSSFSTSFVFHPLRFPPLISHFLQACNLICTNCVGCVRNRFVSRGYWALVSVYDVFCSTLNICTFTWEREECCAPFDYAPLDCSISFCDFSSFESDMIS